MSHRKQKHFHIYLRRSDINKLTKKQENCLTINLENLQLNLEKYFKEIEEKNKRELKQEENNGRF